MSRNRLYQVGIALTLGMTAVIPLAAYPQVADAATLRLSPIDCVPNPSGSQYLQFDSGSIQGSSSTSPTSFYCPVNLDDKTYLDISSLDVLAHDGNSTTQICVQSCRADFVAFDGGCSGYTCSGNSYNGGLISLSPSISAWGSGAGGASIYLLGYLYSHQRMRVVNLTY